MIGHPSTTDIAAARIDEAVAAHPAAWYRVPDGRHDITVSDASEFLRLLDAANDAGVPLWLVGKAARIIAQKNGCSIAEAWDRLAFNLEVLAGKRLAIRFLRSWDITTDARSNR